MAVTADHVDSHQLVAISEPRTLVRAGAVAAALLAVAVYANTFGHGVVADDVSALTVVRTGHGVLDWRHFFLEPGPAERGSVPAYRPVTFWSFALVDVLGATSPAAQHVANVLLHAATAAAVVLAVAAAGIQPTTAIFAGALFAVHPIHTEAVAHLAGRSDLLAGLFALLALLGWLRALASQRPGPALVFALTSYGISLLAGEQALPLVLVLLLADVLGLGQRSRAGERTRPVFYGAVLALTAGYLALRHTALAGGPEPDQTLLFQGNPAALVAPPVRMLTSLRFLAIAVSLLCVPLHLSATYSYHQYEAIESLASPGAMAGLAVGIGLLVVGVVLWLRSRRAFFWFAFAVLFYGVVSNVPFVTGTLLREDRLYLPSVGFCALLAMLLVRPVGFPLRAVGVVLAGALVIGGGMLTVRRNPVWRDELALALATVDANTESAQAHRMLGNAYISASRDQEALEQFTRAVSIYPSDKSSLYNVGVLMQKYDKPIEALGVFRRIVDIDPSFAPAWINIGAVNNSQSSFAPALDAADRAIAAHPDIPNAYVVRGVALRGLQRFTEARAAFEEALRLAPSMPEALLGLGATAVDLEDWELGAKTFRQLVNVAPVHDAYRGLVYTLRQGGHGSEASEIASVAHEKFPDDEFFAPEPPPSQ